jgi:hypothetical protein
LSSQGSRGWSIRLKSEFRPLWLLSFGYLRERLKERSFAEEEDLLSVLSELMSKFPSDMILRVFADWDRPLRHCLLTKEGYIE